MKDSLLLDIVSMIALSVLATAFLVIFIMCYPMIIGIKNFTKPMRKTPVENNVYWENIIERDVYKLRKEARE